MWLHREKQLRHDGGDAGEVSRPVRAAQRLADLGDFHPGLKACRVDFLGSGEKQRADALALAEARIARIVARILLEVARRVELDRVDEDRDHDRVGAPPRIAHQREMPVVQRAHGRHQGDGATRTPLGR